MTRLLAYAAKSPVFANLLMVFLIAAGAVALKNMRREMFPEFTFDVVTVTAIYPGAAPEEIERSVTIKVEESVRGLAGVHKVESTSSEGSSVVRIEIDSEVADPRQAMIDIRNEVARITTFPEDVDEPEVKLILNRRDVATLALAGPLAEEGLTHLARELEEDLLLLPEVSDVQVAGLRARELAVLLREDDLQRYGLTFGDVTRAIRRASLDLPLGKMRSVEEEQLLRVRQQRQVGKELADVPVLTRPDGAKVLLRQVARIEDGFDEDVQRLRIDGEPAVLLTVGKTSDQDTIRVAEAVKAWVQRRTPTLPAGVQLTVWNDGSQAVKDRLGMLTENGLQGLVLVFGVLVVFLGLRLSFWVAFGLPVAFLTAMVLLDSFGGSLNMISSFGLIMVLGILVDDSIVVSENIARHMKEKGFSVTSALEGLREVSLPVIASVTTTAVAFMPLFFISGMMGKFIRVMPVAVIACLIASLIECLLILPAHLAHGRPPRQGRFDRLRARIDAWSTRFIDERYGPTLDWGLKNRYVMLAVAAALFILVMGLIGSGRPGYVFFPRLDSRRVQAKLTMPQGTSLETTQGVVDRIAKAGETMRQRYGQAADGLPIVRRILTRVGEGGSQKGNVTLELARSSQRDVKAVDIIKAWREAIGPVPEARSLSVDGMRHAPGGRPMELRILTPTLQEAEPAADAVRAALASYPGVYNLEDNMEPGKRELRFDLQPGALALGVRVSDLASQLQDGFSGDEVMELQRGREEVEVRVRYASDQRRQVEQLDDMRLRVEGGLIPLGWAADMERARSLSRIERRDGRRVILIQSDIDTSLTNANDIRRSLEKNVLTDMKARYPQLQFAFGGQQEEQQETNRSLGIGFLLACLGIYAILALLFGSYLQPAIVMLVIPLGFAGAAVGHMVVGLPLAIMSVFGMVGLTGIVVNDSLVLIDFVNRKRREGATALEAAAASGRVRFRPVFLTTVTTVVGLLPIMLERSLQAQFVIPMAVSIAAGVTTATALTLYVVPCAYLVIEDARRVFVRPVEPVKEGLLV